MEWKQKAAGDSMTAMEYAPPQISEGLVIYCRTTSASTAPCTSRRTCCPAHCASYCADAHLLIDDAHLLIDDAHLLSNNASPTPGATTRTTAQATRPSR